MNHAVVVDASVAVKWVLQEDFSDRARALLQDCAQARRPVLGPAYFPSEVTNAIYQRLRSTDRRIHITETEAYTAIAQFLEISRLAVQLVASEELYRRAFAFAETHRPPNIYDSLYVVLAEMLDAELWTADQRLLNTVSRVAPWVRPIEDFGQTK